MTIAELKAAIAKKAAEAASILDAAKTAGRDLTDDEKSRATTLINECQGHKNEIAKLEQADRAAKAHETLANQLAALGDLAKSAPDTQLPDSVANAVGVKTLGALFTEGKSYLDLLSALAMEGGHIPSGQQFTSKAHRLKGIIPPSRRKTLVTGASDTSAGALVVNDFRGLLAGLDQFQRPLTLNDLISQGTTQSDTVEYVKVTGFTNNAATVAEATSSAFTAAQDVSGGGYKPESALALVRATAVVQTIAHWIPATTRALADAGQIRQLIDDFLAYGLREELEDQEMNGNGSSPNFDGITHVSGTQSQAFSTNILETTRKARTKVRTVGRSTPTAYVMNPADWETIDLLQDNEARYFYGGPARMGVPTLWGLPVVECEAIAAGTAVVGDFRKAVLWDREQASIQVSNQHLDFFTRNLVAILAEMRAAFGVIQPNAFVIIDLTP